MRKLLILGKNGSTINLINNLINVIIIFCVSIIREAVKCYRVKNDDAISEVYYNRYFMNRLSKFHR